RAAAAAVDARGRRIRHAALGVQQPRARGVTRARRRRRAPAAPARPVRHHSRRELRRIGHRDARQVVDARLRLRHAAVSIAVATDAAALHPAPRQRSRDRARTVAAARAGERVSVAGQVPAPAAVAAGAVVTAARAVDRQGAGLRRPASRQQYDLTGNSENESDCSFHGAPPERAPSYELVGPIVKLLLASSSRSDLLALDLAVVVEARSRQQIVEHLLDGAGEAFDVPREIREAVDDALLDAARLFLLV